MVGLALVCGLFAGLACTPESPNEPNTVGAEGDGTTAVSFIDAGGLSLVLPCTGPDTMSNTFQPRWPCNKVIRVSGPSSHINDIDDAVDKWNAALVHDSVPGIPSFEQITSGTADVIVLATASPGADLCMAVDVLSRPMIVTDDGPCSSNADTYSRILLHEFSHVLGFNKSMEKVGRDGISDHCAFHLPDSDTTGTPPNLIIAPAPVNGSVCQHEIEFIYKHFGQLAEPFDANNFWNRHIVTGVNTNPPSVEVGVGQSTPVVVTALTFDRSGDSIQPVAPGSTPIDWDVLPAGIAGVSSSGLVTGLVGGTARVIVGVGQVVSDYFRSTTLIRAKDSVPLFVSGGPPPNCQPGSTLRVTAITADQEPAITLAGNHTFTATTVGCDPETVTYRWTFDPSKPGEQTVIFPSGSDAQIYDVPAGNYTITVTALPSDSSGTGFALTRGVNVCTDPPGGGGGLFGQKDGGVGTNAAGGCGGAGGGPF